VVKRIDAIFDVEREINGRSIDKCFTTRRERVAPLVSALETWMRTERAKLSRHSEVAKAMNYMLNRWETFTRFLQDGRICPPTTPPSGRCVASRSGASRGCSPAPIAAASARGRDVHAIQTARLNDVDPQAWLADVARSATALELEERASQARRLRCSLGIRATTQLTSSRVDIENTA
jgi:transposase